MTPQQPGEHPEIAQAKAWWSAIEMPRRLALIALALCLFSQHFEYQQAYSYTKYFGGWNIPENEPGVSGWEMHPGALFLLAGLAAVFLTNLRRQPLVVRLGYWAAAAVMLVFCISGQQVATVGGRLGGLSLLLMLGAGALSLRSGGSTGR